MKFNQFMEQIAQQQRASGRRPTHAVLSAVDLAEILCEIGPEHLTANGPRIGAPYVVGGVRIEVAEA